MRLWGVALARSVLYREWYVLAVVVGQVVQMVHGANKPRGRGIQPL
jgi:hypothetical protein